MPAPPPRRRCSPSAGARARLRMRWRWRHPRRRPRRCTPPPRPCAQATPAILAANAKDLAAARAAGRPAAFIDRLLLNEARIEAMAKGVEEIAALADPVGTVLAEWTRPNGLALRARARAARRHRHHLREPSQRDGRRRRAGLKAGNAAILRAGSESLNSALAIHAALVAGLEVAPGCPRRRSSSCRRPTAPPSATCWRASTAPST